MCTIRIAKYFFSITSIACPSSFTHHPNSTILSTLLAVHLEMNIQFAEVRTLNDSDDNDEMHDSTILEIYDDEAVSKVGDDL